MEDREMAEPAALPAILQNLIARRQPPHDNTSDPAWRQVFENANYIAQRFRAVYSRNQRD